MISAGRIMFTHLLVTALLATAAAVTTYAEPAKEAIDQTAILPTSARSSERLYNLPGLESVKSGLWPFFASFAPLREITG